MKTGDAASNMARPEYPEWRSHMLEGLRRSWRLLKKGKPGHRFQSQYEAQQKSRRPAWARPVWLAAGTVIMALGVVALPAPGPGFLVIGLGGAPLRGESTELTGQPDPGSAPRFAIDRPREHGYPSQLSVAPDTRFPASCPLLQPGCTSATSGAGTTRSAERSRPERATNCSPRVVGPTADLLRLDASPGRGFLDPLTSCSRAIRGRDTALS